MNEKWFRFVPRSVCSIEGDGGAPAGGAAVSDPAPVATADPAAPTVDPAAPVVDAVDPNDPLASLTADIDKLAEADVVDPAAAPEVGAVPPEFQEALQLSPFVTNPAQVQQAVRAADEVWKVASGELPASSLFEGLKGANPQRYQEIVNEAAQYIEQVTGKKFGGEQAAADPVEQLRQEILQKEQAREQAHQQQQFQIQSAQANKVAGEFIATQLKSTLFEGNENYFIERMMSKLQSPQESMKEVLAGNMRTVEAAMKAVRKEEVARFQQYTKNFIKQRGNLAKTVPATQLTPKAAVTADAKMLPGETKTQFATRLWEQSKPKP
jgi:hypothetical protein